MIRHRPESTVRNGCGPLALAAVIGGTDVQYATPTTPRRGMELSDMQAVLKQHVVHSLHYVWARYRSRGHKLCDYLRLNEQGIVIVRFKRVSHALAFDGKMVYDTMSDGRWLWVYDHRCAKYRVTHVIRVHDQEAV